MRDRNWQIGLFGTFDVENYGDLLFPLIAEAELGHRLGRVELHRFSYHARTTPDWPYAVTSVTELPRLAAQLDGVLIGGGFVIRYDKDVAPGYGPPTDAIHHPTGYWLTPALIALQNSIPLIWNSPGMHCNEIPRWSEELMKLAIGLSPYVAVRDKPSQNALARFAGKDQISVVPDTGFAISRLVTGPSSLEYRRLCDELGLKEPYIIVQAALGLDAFWRLLNRRPKRLADYRVLSLPIGPVLGDNPGIPAGDFPGLVRVQSWPHPLVLAELVSHSDAVIGYSHHLAITALAFGVPVFTPVDLSVGKYSTLSNFETVYSLSRESEPDLDWLASRLGRRGPEPGIDAAQDALAKHWDRVASLIEAGPTDTRAAMHRFWQSLPGFLEALEAERDDLRRRMAIEREVLEDERAIERQVLENERAILRQVLENERGVIAGQASTIALLKEQDLERQGRIDELIKLLSLARSEIVSRDDRIEDLRTSPSWRVTAPLRFIRRNIKRLTSGRNGQ